jgi:Dyp-type peroxidase family
LVARGYGSLPAARFVLLEIANPPAARAWLGALADRITPAATRPDDRALHVAFTATGLTKLGLAAETLAAFSHQFVGGMTTAHRRRVLGDVDASDPDRWGWGGPATRPVDVLLLLYARDEAGLAGLHDELAAGFGAGGVAQVETLDTAPLTDREHFGFRDGISQPSMEGLARTDTPANTIKAGEFVLGYQNEYGLYTDRPLLKGSDDPRNLLPPGPGGSGARDLGRNGTYLVFRQLSQDVYGFWRFLDSVIRAADGRSDPAARTWLAAKMVGRWPDGAPMTLSPNRDDPALANVNDFGYGKSDLDGLKCPIGAHIRRAHPRDSLDPEPGTDRSIELDKRHRLLRRGRLYGPPVAPEERLRDVSAGDDDPPRGLHFICLCANIARQFEFVQHTWINNQKFDRLYDDVDPLIGQRGPGGATFTLPRRPIRRRITGIPSFVTVRGGGYFFLPGLRAIRYLASLPG